MKTLRYPNLSVRRTITFLSTALLLTACSELTPTASMPAPSPTLQTAAVGYSYAFKWGSLGAQNGQFNRPSNIAIDSSDNVYVTDSYNHRVQKFSSNGTFLAKWGSQGSGNGQFNLPVGIATDSNGNVYVVDNRNFRVQKFSSTGTFLTQWGSEGAGEGQFGDPVGVTTDSSGNVYIADWGYGRIQKFDANGTFLTQWGRDGVGDVRFVGPSDISIDNNGNFYVADVSTESFFITKFNASGNLLDRWETLGTGEKEFAWPQGVTTDSSGNVYVADTGNRRIQKFDANGNFLTQWGVYGTGNGQFIGPDGIAVNSVGNVYVVDRENNRIQVFTPQNAARNRYKVTTNFANYKTVSSVRLGNGMISTMGTNPRPVLVKGRPSNALSGYARTKNGKLFVTKSAAGTAPNGGGGFLIYDFAQFASAATKTIEISGVNTTGGTVKVFKNGVAVKSVNIAKQAGTQTLNISAADADWVQVRLTGVGYADNFSFDSVP